MTDEMDKMKLSDKLEDGRRDFLKKGVAVTGAAMLGNALGATTALAGGDGSSSQETVQWLFVQNASDVFVDKGKLALVDVNPMTIFFSDRPKRLAGHMTTEDFVLDWQEGTTEESFHSDPPNAALSVFGEDEIVDVVVELMNPRWEGSHLVYDTNVLGDEVQMPSGPASLFIDPVGAPLSPTSVAGVHRRHRRRRRRRVRHVVR